MQDCEQDAEDSREVAKKEWGQEQEQQKVYSKDKLTKSLELQEAIKQTDTNRTI